MHARKEVNSFDLDELRDGKMDRNIKEGYTAERGKRRDNSYSWESYNIFYSSPGDIHPKDFVHVNHGDEIPLWKDINI